MAVRDIRAWFLRRWRSANPMCSCCGSRVMSDPNSPAECLCHQRSLAKSSRHSICRPRQVEDGIYRILPGDWTCRCGSTRIERCHLDPARCVVVCLDCKAMGPELDLDYEPDKALVDKIIHDIQINRFGIRTYLVANENESLSRLRRALRTQVDESVPALRHLAAEQGM